MTAAELSNPATDRRAETLAAVYLTLLCAAQVSLALGAGLIGAVLHVVLVVGLIGHQVIEPHGSWAPLVPGLVLVSLTFVIALATASAADTPVPRTAIAGIPLLIAVAGALARQRQIRQYIPPAHRIPRSLRRPLVAVAGLAPVPVLGTVRGAHDAGFGAGSIVGLFAATVVVVACIGLYEELLFRGLLYEAFEAIHPRLALPATTALFALAYLSTGSIGYAVTAGAAGALFGWLRHITGRVAAAAAAHSVTSVLVLVVLPAIGQWR
jgi:hypothetical protein